MSHEKQVFPGQLPELEHVLGERVCVKTKSGMVTCGILQFVGHLPLLPSWGLVCTIDRMPGIPINSIADIELCPEAELIVKR